MSNWIKALSKIENIEEIHNLRDLISIKFRDGRTDIIAYKNNKDNLTVRELDFLIKEKSLIFYYALMNNTTLIPLVLNY